MDSIYQPYQNPNYQAPAPWANANTYAPFSVPNGDTGSNPSFGGYGAEGHTQMSTWPSDFLLQGSWFGTGRKRSSPNFYAPSYQGSLFTPSEGLPQWFSPSAEGLTSNYLGQDGMNEATQQATPTQQVGTMSGSSGLNSYDMPNYIGQMPWTGDTVGSYAPNYAASYRGYDTYGGFGNSGNKQQSVYQPFVPTGSSGIGQY